MASNSETGLEVRLEAAFDCERLQITRVSGTERISKLFRFEISLVSLDPSGLDLPSVIGQRAALVFLDAGGEVRRISGMISEATDQLDSETAFTTYRLVLVPRAFQLSLVQTQEIYLDRSVPEIIALKAENIGLKTDFELRLMNDHAPREFVVQYAETDLSFVSRLAEHLGISFFFDEGEGGDRIIFTDHKNGFRRPEGDGRAAFRKRGDLNGIHRLDLTQKVIPTLYAVSDYDYEKPLVDLTSTCSIEGGFGGGVVEWGANFKDPKEGLYLAQVRMEERLIDGTHLTGASSVCALGAGARFVVDDHPRLGQPEILITEVTHELTQSALAGGTGRNEYSNTFTAIFAAMTYRPPRVTPRPRIVGLMNGIIDTAPGVEVEHPWIDDKGRYTVRVLFDTAPRGERKASLPIRMAQAHAGPNYGIHHPLRPGIEVLLAFVEGDPDRPLIVGSVPNGVTPNPVVDADHTLHRVRTWSGVLVEIDDGA